ncbi:MULTISPECIES: acyl-CoA dehydrogenase family protein [unclassified Streptomyces]|uniref:acyl-CoA dehydrogenase family protein n=1 Tax=unclassified Streptomyces TaxID=2593676 RepID=UPI002E2ECB64|nr:acyl-CoA dehydrogenase family protein [Streptomyces sp. NBC_01280]WSE20306.1 acyl-CoA/acyl-ACP dehydrogenase [Streptomyces sp. NBC_01397]
MSQFADELRSLVDDLAASGRPDLWGSLCDLGLPRVGIDEAKGGSGGSLDDLLVVVESLAGHGIGVPVVEASTADWVLGHGRELDGDLTTILLLDRAPDTASGTLTAELTAVPWARDAAHLVLCAPDSAPLLVDLRHTSVTVRDVENIAGEPRDTVILTDTPVLALDTAPSHDEVRERLALLWSAAVLGAARGAYKLTKTYVSEREQFGAPLLKIPAVSGNLARMRVQLVQAEAALALAREAEPLSGAVGIARITTAAAATEIAQIAHQLHGAMGITEEYPLHRLTRRLWSWRDAVASERRWAENLGRRAAGAGETGVWTRITATGR